MIGGWQGVGLDKAIKHLREQLALHGGINIDRMARDKGKEIRETGKVEPFIDAEFLRRI